MAWYCSLHHSYSRLRAKHEVWCGNMQESAEYDTVRLAKRNHLEGDTANPFCDIRVDFVYPVSSIGVGQDTLQYIFIQNMFGNCMLPCPHKRLLRPILRTTENYTYDADTYRESVSDMMALNELIRASI